MDFSARFIRVIPGKLADVTKELMRIFGRGPGGKRGERRWIIYHDEPSWYDPANAIPVVAIMTFDIEQDKIESYLRKKELAV